MSARPLQYSLATAIFFALAAASFMGLLAMREWALLGIFALFVFGPGSLVLCCAIVVKEDRRRSLLVTGLLAMFLYSMGIIFTVLLLIQILVYGSPV